MAERRKFPGPWSGERAAGDHFVFNDANGFSLAYVYQREGPGMYGTYFADGEHDCQATQRLSLRADTSAEIAS
jgi:hypothetical protein